MNSELISQVSESLLAPAGLSEIILPDIMGKLLGGSIDSADLYFQSSRAESWILDDGMIKEGSHDIERGVGVRAISGEKTGFAYCDDIVLNAIEAAAVAARSIARHGSDGQLAIAGRQGGLDLYPIDDPIASLSPEAKVDLLRRLDAEARRQDPRVDQVTVSLIGVYEHVLMFDSEGMLTADIRPLVRVNVSVIVEDKGRRESGYAGGGGRGDYRLFTDNDGALFYAREAVRQALVSLVAQPAPAGVMPVVVGPGWPGVLLHEAVGHGLEGDFNRKGHVGF